ncbi:hypothetical protein CPB86DRAFT_810513 [Serendipita vermifera]|nr:hypothetical protein CPB86DRAFT_810513 [Serendipita vermifera]
MELDPIERNGTKFARLFGLAKEPKRLRDPLVLTEETTAWDIYNHRAAEVDREQIKDWNDSLNTLLIFAALYSAILTAFIIESAKLLEEDPAKTTRDILLVISKQLANNTVPAFAQAKYAVPEYATIVNALLFSSLSCALSTALLAVLALQWVANYDRGLSTSSAQKRALHRQMRLRGIESWKMGELIAILPLTIFLSLFLFFIGIAYWLWHVQRTPSKIVIGGMSVAALLYAITTIISTIYIEAPFRSSVSKGMAVLLRQIIAWPDSLVITSSINDIKLTDGKLGSFDLSWLSACTSSLRSVYSFIWLLPREFLLRIWSHLQRWRIAYNGAPLSSKHFENYEEMILEGNDGVAMDSLLWLASSVEISLQSRRVLLILVRSLMELPPDLLMDIEKTRNIAWEPIFTILCAPFLGKWGISQFTPNELKEATFVCQALSILSTGINSPEFQAFYLSLKKSDDGQTSASAELAYYRHISQSAADLNRVMMRTCTSLSSVEPFYLRSILLSIQNAWPDLKEHDKWAIYKELAYGCVVPSDVLYNKSRFPTIPLQSLDLIFDFVAQSLMPPKQLEGTTPADRYVTAIRQINENHYLYRCIAGMHQSIQRQILAQIARVNLESPIGRNQFGSLLLPLLSITKHRFLPLCYEELDDFVNVLLKVYKEDRDCIQETERDRTHLVGPQFHLPNYQETGRHLDLIAIFDEFIINRVDFSSQQKYSCLIETVIWLLTHWGEYLNLPAVSYCTRFKDIKDPCLALVSTKYHPEDKYSSNLLEPVEEPFIQTTLAESGIWKDGVDQMVFKAWKELDYDVIGSKLRTHLLQSTLIEGSWNARQGAMEVLERQEFNVCDDMEVFLLGRTLGINSRLLHSIQQMSKQIRLSIGDEIHVVLPDIQRRGWITATATHNFEPPFEWYYHDPTSGGSNCV